MIQKIKEKFKNWLSLKKYHIIFKYLDWLKRMQYRPIWVSGLLSAICLFFYFEMDNKQPIELYGGILCAGVFLLLSIVYIIFDKYHTKHYYYYQENGQLNVIFVADVTEYKKLQDMMARTSTPPPREERKTEQNQKEKESIPEEKPKSEPTMDYFDGVETLEQAKDRYRKLLKIYHPDVNAGSTKMTEIINNQYAEMQKRLG